MSDAAAFFGIAAVTLAVAAWRRASAASAAANARAARQDSGAAVDGGAVISGGGTGALPWSSGSPGFKLGLVQRLTDGHTLQELLLLSVPRLTELLPEHDAKADNATRSHEIAFNLVDESSVIIGDIVRKAGQRATSRAYVRAGPRATTYFAPQRVRAAIVTCGGLCPGLNNVIRELVYELYDYGAEKVYGIRGGFWGFHTKDADPEQKSPNCPRTAQQEPQLLTLENTANIQHLGGTVLGSDRGGTDPDVALRFCLNRGINQLYIIGGDGTHRGAHAIFQRITEARIPMSVAAIPKTIDNDVDIIDRSFGFETSYAEAQLAIKSAKVEAAGAVNGIGIVKLMGRYAGFIAAYASVASGDVDLCLIPEVPIRLDGPASIFGHLERVLKSKGHAVVVVAEGAGEELLDAEITAAGGKVEVDAGGNRKLPAIGPWLQRRIAEHFAAAGVKPTIKYIDPSYIIRSVKANAADAVYCTLLAQNAVHGAMAGFTGFSTGLVNNRMVYLPITAITANSPRRMNPRGRTYQRLLAVTGMPDALGHPEYYGSAAPAEASKGSE